MVIEIEIETATFYHFLLFVSLLIQILHV